MSYYNSEQLAYMDDLAKIPPEQKCWCGWYRLGECLTCGRYRPGKTCADKLAAQCPNCNGRGWIWCSPPGTGPTSPLPCIKCDRTGFVK